MSHWAIDWGNRQAVTDARQRAERVVKTQRETAAVLEREHVVARAAAAERERKIAEEQARWGL
jgi:hypothetical protein